MRLEFIKKKLFDNKIKKDLNRKKHMKKMKQKQKGRSKK